MNDELILYEKEQAKLQKGTQNLIAKLMNKNFKEKYPDLNIEKLDLTIKFMDERLNELSKM